MTLKLRLPTPTPQYDQRNEAETRREIELLLLKSAGGVTALGAARRTVIFATGNLANGETELGSTDFGAPGQHLIMITSDVSARVRLYADQDVRDDDEDRPASTAPSAGIGMFLDAVWATTHTKYIAPPVFLYNADSPVASRIYYAVTNTSGATTPVTVTAVVISAETGPLGLNPTDDSTVDGEVFNLAGATNGQILVRTGGVWMPADFTLDDNTLDGEDVDMTGATDGDVLWRVAGVWVPEDPQTVVPDDTIDGESVDLTGAANDEFLQRVGGVWVSNPVPDDTLDGDDVDTAGKSDGDVLTWSSANSQWEPQAGGGGGGGSAVFPDDASTFGTAHADDEEWEGDISAWTVDTALTGAANDYEINGTFTPSRLRVRITNTTGSQLTIVKAMASGSGDQSVTFDVSGVFAHNFRNIGIGFSSSGTLAGAAGMMALIHHNGAPQVIRRKYSNIGTGAHTDQATISLTGSNETRRLYLHLQRASDVWSAWYSLDGTSWDRIQGTTTDSFTISHIWVSIGGGGASSDPPFYLSQNWIRFNRFILA